MMKKLMRAVAFAGLMFLVACSPKTEYTHALPKDASVVVALDLDEMAQKSGLASTEGQTVVNKLKGFLKGGLQGDAAQLAERIIDNPSESGLALEEKVYMFATPHAQAYAILAKVADESKIESMLGRLTYGRLRLLVSSWFRVFTRMLILSSGRRVNCLWATFIVAPCSTS